MSGNPAKKVDSSSSLDLNLTFGDPLYLHPNDTGGSPIVTIKLTGTDNYKDDTNHALANQWDMCNYVVFTWILNSLSSDLYDGAIYAKTAFELWTDLKDTYDKVDGSAVFNLHKSINSLSQSGASIADYYNNLYSLWKQFDANMLGKNCLNIKGTLFNGSVKFNLNFKRYFNGNTCFVVGNISLGWIVNSGANQHMTVFANFLVNVVDISNLGLTVGHPNGLHLFDVDKACKIVSNNCISSCFVSKSLWHQRLGHPSDQVLDVLKTYLNLDSQTASDHLCDTCNKAKQNREPFPLSDHKSNKIGRVSSNDDGTELSPNVNQGNDDSGATSMDETNNTHLEGTIPNETNFINEFYEHSELNSDVEELPANTVRRSSRQTKLPSSLNDFIIKGKVKYGVERVRDVNNAFLYGDLDEDIYMTIPKGIANKDNKNKSANDHSLFTKSKNNKFIALLVYVDDIVVTENCVDEIDKKYCLELLKYYGLLGCKPVSTPMVPNSVLPYELTEDDSLLDNIAGYQKLLGKLIYLTHTRPDIAYYVHCLAQYMHSPLKSHLSCALNVLRYLKGAPGKGIRYKYPDILDTIVVIMIQIRLNS
ncbi:ribonuclease H-like domain-containing protein [Tanacetum coccineum]